MSTKLVIVESPAKARTLSRILGKGYTIIASMGHVRDLPAWKLGVDLANDFSPMYVIPKERKKTIDELKASADDATAIFLATDPDREGESISWHLVEAAALKKHKVPLHRVAFHEITKEAVEGAFKHPRDINMNLVDAQQARRILDRLVGYKLSPLLWKKIQRGLSAGRVQSAAVKILVDREKEIRIFVQKEYWTIVAELAKKAAKTKKQGFLASLISVAGETKIDIPDKKAAEKIKADLENAVYSVKSVNSKMSTRNPAPPFTTSTMQQEAWRKLHFTAKRTMAIAQQLYEGINIGKEGSVGLITYMRTDSTHVAPGALTETREYIENKFGKEYLPSAPRHFAKKSKFSQEAHEAIRPTKTHREPEQMLQYLKPEQLKLYELIWKRMVASQMSSASFDTVTVEITAKAKRDYLFKAVSSVMKFPGFITLYIESEDEAKDDDNAVRLPEMHKGDTLDLLNIIQKQNFTQPPPRYTEATLIKAMEQKGIGRPSTYAPIISTIQDREYTHKEAGKFIVDELGEVVNNLLENNFPDIVNLSFTAQMENDLDAIAQGQKQWVPVLREFYTPFEEKLAKASETIIKINMDKETDEKCPDCGKPMVIKVGRFGKFLACSGYPDCKKTKNLLQKTGIPCPECGLTEKGELVPRKSKRKTTFYGCNRYPDCRFTSWQKPVPQPCPQCGKLMVINRGNIIKCTSCDYKGKMEEMEKTAAAV
jgi:DNA topoisomerase-1